MNVVMVCGSLGPRSANRAALDVAARSLADNSAVSVTEVTTLEMIPPFKPDLVDNPPESVTEFGQSLEAADLVLLAAPEYAAGLAGAMKNALDWLVGLGSLYHQLVAVLSAGTTGGGYATEQLVRTLTWQGALVVSVLGIDFPRTKTDDDGNVNDAATIEAIEAWATTALGYCTAPPAARLGAVAQIITPYGIDPARFGSLS